MGLPIRTSREAPRWEQDGASRDVAERYFEDLEEVFDNHQILTDDEKKKGVIRYVPVRYAQLWRSLPEYTTATYPELKEKILSLFLGTDSTRPWTVQDYNAVIGTYAHTNCCRYDVPGTVHLSTLLCIRNQTIDDASPIPGAAHIKLRDPT